jgi:hypothetical protein
VSAGGRDLSALLANASPLLHPAPVAVATIADGEIPESLRAHVIGTFREAEGLTVYLDGAATEAAGLRIVFRAAWITMNVHSDLEAIGFTAAFARALAARGIAANVVAGAFHDHIFVRWDKAQEAMAALSAL